MSWLTEPDSDWDSTDPDSEPPRSRLRLVALLLGAWLAVSLVVLLVLLLVGGHHSGNSPAASGSRSSSASPGTGSASSAGALPAGWKQQAADDQTNCAAHAYGQVATFFARTPCRSVHRLLATTSSSDGRTIVIASNVVTFASDAQAKSYLALVNADGTGNIADLLREGLRYPGGPTALPTPAAFASAQDGAAVHVAEAGYVTGTSSADDPSLQAAAKQGV